MMMRTRGALLHRLVLVVLVTLTLTGCARVFGSYDIAPNGLARGEDRLRQLLARGQADAALARVNSEDAPHDDVLRTLYQGVVSYHAGDFAESAQLLDAAAVLADDRVTKSISASALSLVSNDLVLPYEPGPTERLMIPYYGALARLRLGDTSGAAVEARRLSHLLQFYDDDGRVDATLRATLRYFAASIFAAAGELQDADVAYRNAVALGSTLPAPVPASRDSGTVIVVLEQGFVAHRAEQALLVMLLPEEIDALSSGDGDGRAGTAALVAGRVLQHATHVATYAPEQRIGTLFVPPPEHTPRKRIRRKTVCEERTVAPADSTQAAKTVKDCREVEEEVDDLPYLLKVAWPVYRLDAAPAGVPRLLCQDDTVGFGVRADLSRAVVRDYDRERTLVVARTLVRGAAKAAISRGAERKLEEKNETVGKLVGLLGNVGNVLLERADTRSWHLLPAGVAIAQVQLAAGEHALAMDVPGSGNVSLGNVSVRAGQVSIIPVRAWQ